MHFSLLSAMTIASVAVASPIAASNPCAAAAGSQVIKFSGFENGNSFQTQNVGSGDVYARVVDHGYKSGHSLANTINAPGNGAEGVEIVFTGIKTCNGASYTYSIDYKYLQYNTQYETSINAFVQYGPEDPASGPTVVLPSSENSGTAGTNGLGVWSRQSQVFTAQDHLGKGSLLIQIATNGPLNVTALLDNISITKNA